MKKIKIMTIIGIISVLALAGMLDLPVVAAHSHYSNPRAAHAEIQKKKKQTRAKINHLKFLENLETNKLYKNQEKLEATTNSLSQNQHDFENAQNKLSSLQSQLSSSLAEFSEIDFQMRRRIRQIYKNQRSGFFELLLTANDFNNFLDRIYYEGLVIKQDYAKMVYARKKAKQIAMLKYNIEEQKRTISRSIRTITYQKESIKDDIDRNQDMIQRLRTDRSTYERAENDLSRQSASLQAMISKRSGAPSKEAHVSVVSGFIKPISGRITSPFGWRVHPIFNSRSFHSGVDIGGPYGGGIRASNAGRVMYSGWYGGYGKVVILDHGRVNGVPVTTLYAHMCQTNVTVGQVVSKGQVIGREGTTGYSTGPHVHFEVRVNGRPNNPLNYI